MSNKPSKKQLEEGKMGFGVVIKKVNGSLKKAKSGHLQCEERISQTKWVVNFLASKIPDLCKSLASMNQPK